MQRTGQLERAVRHYEHALTLDPGHRYALLNLGSVLKRQGRLAEAASRCSLALSLPEPSPHGYSSLGSIRAAQGRWAESAHSYRRALHNAKFAPGGVLAIGDAAKAGWWLQLGLAQSRMGRSKAPDAKKSLNKAVALQPTSGQALLHLALIMQRQGQGSSGGREQARRWLRQVYAAD